MVAPSLWYHGAVGQWQGWQPSGPTRCDHWNCHLGIHFASKLITAQRFASEANLMPHDYFQYADTWHPSQGQVVTATLNLENPLVLAEEIALDALALAIALDTRLVDYEVLAQPPSPSAVFWPPVAMLLECASLLSQLDSGQLALQTSLPARLLSDLTNFSVPDPAAMAQGLLSRLHERGFDSIIYGNVLEGASAIPPYEPTAICFSPSQMHVFSVEDFSPPAVTL